MSIGVTLYFASFFFFFVGGRGLCLRRRAAIWWLVVTSLSIIFIMYKVVDQSPNIVFPFRFIWNPTVPPKMGFFT